MKNRKLHNYEIYKIETNRFVKHNGKKLQVIPLTLSYRQALENGEVVKIQENQLTHKLIDYFCENNIVFNGDMKDILVSIVVPTEAKRTGEKEYEAIAANGFMLNNQRYVRIASGSGQIRRNTITFIRDDLYEPIFSALLCGLTLEDFGDDFNAAKFNAYCGLNMSGCYLLPEELSPSVCIVDDYEAIRPHYVVNHVTENKVNYIALPDEDYILTDEQTEYDIDGNKAIRKVDGIEFTIHSGIKKNIDSKYYDEIEGSPALNSFDGQGLMSPEWAEKVARYLRIGHIPAELIVRAAWVKGLLVTMPFKEWFEEHGITEIKDSFGKVRQIADIDCIISKSQFKMHKIYKAKCSPMGVNAWDYHQQAMKENHLLWGITRTNSRTDDDVKTLNYQYIQAFQLENDDIDALCGQTEELLRKLNSGDIEEVYKNLVIGGKGLRLNEHYEVTDDSDDAGKKLFQRVIESNPDFINDKYIRSLIFKECETKFNGAKLGKILVNGNFQFCASDPIAQIEWIAKNHCGLNIEVKGIVPAGHIYSNYWLNREEKTDEIVLMRSPLIDRNEIAKRKIICNQEHYFRYLTSGLVYSIYDLTSLQEGGCDFDGDIIFSTNNEIIKRACYDFSTAKPLYYQLSTTNLIGLITQYNLIQADIRGLNSAVGQISNKAGSLYAMLENYAENSPEYAKIYESIVALGQIVGMEIDRIKTAVAPTFPLEWSTLQTCKVQTRDMVEVDISDDDEQEGVFRHNNVVPDVKPYFFRYNYEYLNESINTLDKVFNEVSKPTFGKKWEEVKELCRNGKGNEQMNQLYYQYLEAYPVIDTDCIVNHISHRFEKFERDIYRQTLAEGEKMLKNYIGNTPMQDDILSKVNQLVVAYQRFRCFSAKPIRTKESNKSKSIKANNIRQRVRKYYFECVLELVNGDLQAAFDYLISATNGNEKIIWELFSDVIVEIIKKKERFNDSI